MFCKINKHLNSTEMAERVMVDVEEKGMVFRVAIVNYNRNTTLQRANLSA